MNQSQPDPSVLLEKMQIVYLQAAVHALIQSHPDPSSFRRAWADASASATASVSQMAIAMGHPGVAAEQLETAYRQWQHAVNSLLP